MTQRILVHTIIRQWRPGEIVIVYGPRRVGKTVLLGQLREAWHATNVLLLDGDTQEARDQMGTTSEVRLMSLVKHYDAIFVDEAQRIPHIALALKIIVDRFPEKKIVVTGSSSLDLGSGLKETLTGRNRTYHLYPFSTRELAGGMDTHKIPYLLGDQLVYGSYPRIAGIATWEEKERYLRGLANDYVFRDVLLLERVDESLMRKLAAMLAFQIGSEVSLRELSGTLGVDGGTVGRYLLLLEKSFVIFPLGSYAKNLRREVTRSKKYYFYDIGIRNALIRQFLPVDQRGDAGQLWENFLIVERQKKHEYAQAAVDGFFWRNYVGAEVDYLEITTSGLEAFEFKLGKGIARTPKAFRDSYRVEVATINRETYLDFVL